MMEIDKKYPKFNNWESDTLHGNSKGIMYMGVIVMIYLSISLLTDSRNKEMFVFTFSLLLIIWVPLMYVLFLPKIKGRILEIKGNGLAEYDRKNELKDFHQWDTLVDMRAKHLRYGDVTVLVFSDGVKIKFFEEQWIIETICEKCKQVSMEQYYENKRELKL